ncbi:TDG/mug DNA glycosylase family protein [Pedobacter sp. W3I1]|uniref:G/U mismatch-specific DNA glycosylase n=1 Tax=Pedobacter sp. W3I1 TaxID=3042291 RepID=UPI002788B7A4|nr:G/U mismatch-specific DNA glycosylase [Pedobacter sp. W3I1]MDQ0640286.1 TDG/mug DNA glycosylase family protein [Pedobacter sp. W3I1]
MLTDIIDNNLSVIFCGINPGLKSASDGYHFSGRSNRFWKTLHLAGFTPYEIEPISDLSILQFSYGLTTAVARATARADELDNTEFASSIESFKNKMIFYKPQCIAFLGKAAYMAFTGKKKLSWGPQEEKFCGARIWILPNPSGLNRGFRLNDLVDHYSALQRSLT